MSRWEQYVDSCVHADSIAIIASHHRTPSTTPCEIRFSWIFQWLSRHAIFFLFSLTRRFLVSGGERTTTARRAEEIKYGNDGLYNSDRARYSRKFRWRRAKSSRLALKRVFTRSSSYRRVPSVWFQARTNGLPRANPHPLPPPPRGKCRIINTRVDGAPSMRCGRVFS